MDPLKPTHRDRDLRECRELLPQISRNSCHSSLFLSYYEPLIRGSYFEGVALCTPAGRGPCALVGGGQTTRLVRGSHGGRTGHCRHLVFSLFYKVWAIGGSPFSRTTPPVCGIHRFYNGLSANSTPELGMAPRGRLDRFGVDLGSIWGSIWGIRSRLGVAS